MFPYLLLTLITAATLLPPAAQDRAEPLRDFAVAVRETRLFASLDYYAEILGKVEPGQFFPAVAVDEDEYGVVRAEVKLDDGKTAFLSDVIILRQSESALRRILKRVSFSEIGLWDDDVIDSIQRRGVEIGFSLTQLLLAQGLPPAERRTGDLQVLFYPRIVVLLEGDEVAGFTEILRLSEDKSIKIALTAQDPEFSTGIGSWSEVTRSTFPYMLAKGESAAAEFELSLPVDGTYRITARWAGGDDHSTAVDYTLVQEDKDVAAMTASHRLHGGQWVLLGDADLKEGPLRIRIGNRDGKSFSVESLIVEYLNTIPAPADNHTGQ